MNECFELNGDYEAECINCPIEYTCNSNFWCDNKPLKKFHKLYTVKKIIELLTPLTILGPWRHNKDMLFAINERILNRSYIKIPKFLNEDVVEEIYANLTLRESKVTENSTLTPFGSDGRWISFSKDTPDASWTGLHCPTVDAVLDSRAFSNAMNLLTGIHKLSSFTRHQTIWRHFRPGDFISPHDDVAGGCSPRQVCINYYITKDWDEAWGGNFVWYSKHSTKLERIPPSFNTGILFHPHFEYRHLVERVSHDARSKRFSFTKWVIA